jgi:lauroyl/myristoyl acyltransferase
MTGSRLLFWLVIKPVSLLPYPLLYKLSDFFYVIFYYLIGYRKKVVYQNLKKNTLAQDHSLLSFLRFLFCFEVL